MGFDRILQLNSPTFANKEAYLQNVGLFNFEILSNPTVTVLYPVSLLFALHHFLDREVVLFTCFRNFYSSPGTELIAIGSVLKTYSWYRFGSLACLESRSSDVPGTHLRPHMALCLG